MKTKLILPIIVLFSLFSCSENKTSKTETNVLNTDSFELDETQLKNLNIGITSVKSIHLKNKAFLNGRVAALPNLTAQVSSDINGKIEKVYVHGGDFVKKGQKLFMIKSTDLLELENQYLEAKAEADFMLIEYQRQEELRKKNVGALADFQMTDAKYKAAKNRELALRTKLDMLKVNVRTLTDLTNAKMSPYIEIYSPLEGYVSAMNATVGMLTSTDIVLAEVVNVSELQAKVAVYDRDLDMVSDGAEVLVDFLKPGVEPVKGKIYHIERAVDEVTRAITVHVKFSVPKNFLVLPDMNVRVILPKEKDTSFDSCVPFNAVLQEGDQTYVFLTDSLPKNGKFLFTKTKVTTLERSEEFMELDVRNFPKDKKIYVGFNNMEALEQERINVHTSN